MALELASAPQQSQQPDTTPKPTHLRLPKLHAAISNKDRMFFTEPLALLIETGTPIH